MMRAKHEKRLREEQIALEESKKEQIYERKKQRKEKLKKELDRRPNDGVLQLETEDFDWKPRRKRRKELEKEREAEEAAEKRKKEKEQLPSLKFKFGKDVVDMIQKKGFQRFFEIEIDIFFKILEKTQKSGIKKLFGKSNQEFLQFLFAISGKSANW